MLKKIFEKIAHAPKPSDGMFDEVGAIKLDPTPVCVVLEGPGSEQSMRQVLEAYLSSEMLRQRMDAMGEETFDESLDFGDEGESDFPGSPYSLEDERQVAEANSLVQEGLRQGANPPPQEPLSYRPGESQGDPEPLAKEPAAPPKPPKGGA